MSNEYAAQVRNRTFDLVPPAPNQNVIATKWMYTEKYLADGSFDRPKARWVARGDKQEHGIDYAKTFRLVVKSITIRHVLNLAVSRSWPIKQLDVNNAFLQGTLTNEVYVSQPPGFVDPDRPHHVFCLNKALYGLKQAPRAWYQKLKNFLTDMGCINSLADTSAFIYLQDANIVYVLVYVNNIIITGSKSTLINAFIHCLFNRFSSKDPSDIHYFLGIKVIRTSQGMLLMQKKYIVDLLTKMNMLDSKLVSTPLAMTPRLSLNSGSPINDPREYRKHIGSMQYLHLLVLTSIESIVSHSLCIAEPTSIGKRRSVSCVTWLELRPMGSSYGKTRL